MATARHHYADLPLVCQSRLSIMSERYSSRNMMKQKNDLVFLQISPQMRTNWPNQVGSETAGARPQHRIDLGFAGGFREVCRTVERGAVAAWSRLGFYSVPSPRCFIRDLRQSAIGFWTEISRLRRMQGRRDFRWSLRPMLCCRGDVPVAICVLGYGSTTGQPSSKDRVIAGLNRLSPAERSVDADAPERSLHGTAVRRS